MIDENLDRITDQPPEDFIAKHEPKPEVGRRYVEESDVPEPEVIQKRIETEDGPYLLQYQRDEKKQLYCIAQFVHPSNGQETKVKLCYDGTVDLLFETVLVGDEGIPRAAAVIVEHSLRVVYKAENPIKPKNGETNE